MSATESLRSGTQQLAEQARTVSRQAQHQLEALEPTLRQVDERVRSFARERPLLALGGALIGGYLIGRILAARR